MKYSDVKFLSLYEISEAIKTVSPISILHTAAPKKEIDFVRELVSVTVSTEGDKIHSLFDLLKLSANTNENLTKKNDCRNY